jgi:hypothetical protein|tara:strand:- start:439 stop:1128 length:690 start_codon:yes stop_codon:yes gene_type:complete
MVKGFFKSDEDASSQKVSEIIEETRRLNIPRIREGDTINKSWDNISLDDHKTPCQCSMEDGDRVLKCNRHQCLKTPSLHHLCQTRKDYFKLWEEGIGPGQDPVMRHNLINNYPTTKEQILQRKKEWKQELNESLVLNDKDQKTRMDEEILQKEKKAYKKGFFMGDSNIPLESRGVGDTVAKITKATGIKKVVDTAFGAFDKDCGCKERQSKLNKLFPYGKRKKTKGFFE